MAGAQKENRTNLFVIVGAFASFVSKPSLPWKQAFALVERPPWRRSFCPSVVDWGVVLTFVPRMRMVGAA